MRGRRALAVRITLSEDGTLKTIGLCPSEVETLEAHFRTAVPILIFHAQVPHSRSKAHTRGFPPDDAVQLRPDTVLGARTDLVACCAQRAGEDFLALGGIAGGEGRATESHQRRRGRDGCTQYLPHSQPP